MRGRAYCFSILGTRVQRKRTAGRRRRTLGMVGQDGHENLGRYWEVRCAVVQLFRTLSNLTALTRFYAKNDSFFFGGISAASSSEYRFSPSNYQNAHAVVSSLIIISINISWLVFEINFKNIINVYFIGVHGKCVVNFFSNIFDLSK